MRLASAAFPILLSVGFTGVAPSRVSAHDGPVEIGLEAPDSTGLLTGFHLREESTGRELGRDELEDSHERKVHELRLHVEFPVPGPHRVWVEWIDAGVYRRVALALPVDPAP